MTEIRLYINKSDSRVINKILENELILIGDIKTINNYATITIPIDNSINNIENFNYLKIGNKCYFITDKEYVAYNTINIVASLDVLETFKTEILEQTAIISRSENLYNKYLNDNKIVTQVPQRVQTKLFPNEPFNNVSKFILVTS